VLDLGCRLVHDLLTQRRCHHLEADRQTGIVEPDRDRYCRMAGEVGGDGADVGQIHREGVGGAGTGLERYRTFKLLTEVEPLPPEEAVAEEVIAEEALPGAPGGAVASELGDEDEART